MSSPVQASGRRVPPTSAGTEAPGAGGPSLVSSARALAGVTLLAGPAALAFFSGGVFDAPRLVAALGAWALVGVAALAAARPLPVTVPGRAAVGGMALLTAWTGLSLTWAPLAGPALDDLQRLLLYLAALVAAAAFFRDSRMARWVEPGLAAGVVVVIGYGLSERFLPGVLEFARSATAEGRLEQPLTYWNAMGGLAAIGVVMLTRLAGDSQRPSWLRPTAAAATPLAALGVYLSFSRGALAALAAGVVVLVAFDPSRAQLRAVAVSAGAAAIVVAGSLALPSVQGGGRAYDQGDGLILLAVVVLAAAAGAHVTRSLAGRRAGVAAAAPLSRRGRYALAAAVAVLALGWLALSVGVEGAAGPTPSARRLASVESSRYDYWGAALGAFADRPVTGVGSAGFRVEWVRRRSTLDSARDAHSLYLETAAELGLVGVLLLGLSMGGVAASIRRLRRHAPAAAVGPAAALAVWAVQAGVDWVWEVPALTLVAVVLAGSLVAGAEQAA